MKTLGIIFLIFFSIAAILIICITFYPRLVIYRTNSFNRKMEVLRDRANRNPPDVLALKELVQTTHANDSFARTAAIAYLGQTKYHAELVVPALIEALEGVDGFNARAAAVSLGQIGVRAQSAVPSLIKAVNEHPNSDVGWFAAESLGKIAQTDNKSVSDVLLKACTNKDERLSNSAKVGLEYLKSSKVNEPEASRDVSHQP